MAYWLIIHSVLIACLAFALFIVIRQVGVLLNQVGPTGARFSKSGLGPRIGENVQHQLAGFMQASVPYDIPMLLVFGSEACSICKYVQAEANRLAKSWRGSAGIVLIYDELSHVVGSKSDEALKLLSAPGLRESLAIYSVPYAVMLDREATVLGHGLVNDGSHLESLLELTSDVPEVHAKRISNRDEEPGLNRSYAE